MVTYNPIKSLSIWIKKEIQSPHLTQTILESIISGDGRCVIMEENLIDIIKENTTTIQVSTIHILKKQGDIFPTKNGFCILDSETGVFHIVQKNKITLTIKSSISSFESYGFKNIIHFHQSGNLYVIESSTIKGVTQPRVTIPFKGSQKFIMKMDEEETIITEKTFHKISYLNLRTLQRTTYNIPDHMKKNVYKIKRFYLLSQNKALVLSNNKSNSFSIGTYDFGQESKLILFSNFSGPESAQFQSINKKLSTLLILTKQDSRFFITLFNYKSRQVIWRHATLCSKGIYRCISKRMNTNFDQYVEPINSQLKKKVVKYKKVHKKSLFIHILKNSPIQNSYGNEIIIRVLRLIQQDAE